MKKGIKYAIVGGSIVTLAITTFLVGRRVIRNRKAKSLADKLSVGNEDKKGEDLQSYDALADVKVLESYLKGANALYYPSEVSNIIMPLNNADIKKLAEEYKKRNKISLWEQLDGEWDACGFPIPKNCYEAPMEKLRKLNLV